MLCVYAVKSLCVWLVSDWCVRDTHGAFAGGQRGCPRRGLAVGSLWVFDWCLIGARVARGAPLRGHCCSWYVKCCTIWGLPADSQSQGANSQRAARQRVSCMPVSS
ncbi:hypothetical protein COO60DRAFT_1482805 [Scenedesmus sp. NREL 46B-D3]|nr:hypothetical protein COO60DRAFT_1482805 [Scenedesmus sp. NREL 46B-D3]